MSIFPAARERRARLQRIHFALFGYTESTRNLHVVDSNYSAGDMRRDWTFPFGLGLPGRAFKSSEAAVFTRPPDWQSGRPLGYIGGQLASQSGIAPRSMVPEAALLAIPLAPPEAPDWPYAVWQISTDDSEVRLHTADTPNDKALEEVTAALRENLTLEFSSIMQQMHASPRKI